MRPASLPEGKLPSDVLQKILNSIPKSEGGNLVVSPGIGVDVGVTRRKGKYLVSSSDPITGTEKKIGWHAVNVSANDISTSGIMPDTLNTVALFPVSTSEKEITRVMNEINSTAASLRISVAGGHTELTPGLKRPIIVVTAFGSGDSYITAAMAKPGDSVLMTKTAGIEGTSMVSRSRKIKKLISPSVWKSGAKLGKSISVLKEASAAFGTKRVHAMHDVTEGGIIGAVLEMSQASKLGFELDISLIPLARSTSKVCLALGLDPLRLIGSGSMLIASSQNDEDTVIRAVKSRGVKCTKIGRFVRDRRKHIIIHPNGKRTDLLESSVQDEIWAALDKYGFE